jgi:hypothetical protein
VPKGTVVEVVVEVVEVAPSLAVAADLVGVAVEAAAVAAYSRMPTLSQGAVEAAAVGV